jgi:hypothetical protein
MVTSSSTSTSTAAHHGMPSAKAMTSGSADESQSSTAQERSIPRDQAPPIDACSALRSPVTARS